LQKKMLQYFFFVLCLPLIFFTGSIFHMKHAITPGENTNRRSNSGFDLLLLNLSLCRMCGVTW
jgi:hypothetical protein